MTNPSSQIVSALLSAFPIAEEFRMMIYFHFGGILSQITKEEMPYPEQVRETVQFAETTGRLEELVKAGMAANPLNPDLQRIFEMMQITNKTQSY